VIDGLSALREWLKKHKEEREEAALKMIKTDQTKYELSVMGGELKALEDVEDQIERIFKESSAS
jgi:hypothetical protein